MVNFQHLAKANLVIHGFQGLFSVVVMGVIGASMVQEGRASGAARFMFAMCWLNVPALIYLIMAPRYQRTQMFAHPYWVSGINNICLIFWFAAFVAVAAYTNKGISKGEGKEKDENLKKEGGCSVFQAGTGETKRACELNRSAVGLGVFMWFLFITTAVIAGYAAWYYSKNSVSPFEDLSTPSAHEIQETTKDAFSSQNDEYAPINPTHGRNQDDYEDEDIESHQSHLRTHSAASSTYPHSAYSRDDAHPGRPLSWAAEREPYAGIGGHAPIAPVEYPDTPDDYAYRGRMQ